MKNKNAFDHYDYDVDAIDMQMVKSLIMADHMVNNIVLAY